MERFFGRAWRILLGLSIVWASHGILGCTATLVGPPPTKDSSTRSQSDAVRTVHEVFADSDFWWKRTKNVKSPALEAPWFERILNAIKDFIFTILQAIWDLLRKILEGLFGIATGDWSSGSPLIWAVAAVLIGWSLWKLLPLIVGWLRSRNAEPGGKDPRALVQLPAAGDLLNDATKAFQEGRYADAIRLGLLALIARLQHQGLLRYDPAQTNREYQLFLRPEPKLAATFGEVARAYERVWYGQFPTGRDEAERLLGICRLVLTEERSAGE